jgi:hypothetical protein
MTALAAEFFTLDEVNRLKIIQDVIDRRLTTKWQLSGLVSPTVSAAACLRVIVKMVRLA